MTITDREYDDSKMNPLYPHIYMTVPGTDDFREVAAFSDGGGYDWTDWVCWYSPSRRRYFIASGSGCSCNSLSQDVQGIADFEAVTSKEAAKNSLRQFIDGRYDYRELRDRPRIDSELAAINEFRPKETN
jgi:hypothetical protein